MGDSGNIREIEFYCIVKHRIHDGRLCARNDCNKLVVTHNRYLVDDMGMTKLNELRHELYCEDHFTLSSNLQGVILRKTPSNCRIE
jgi:hypothetical protein